MSTMNQLLIRNLDDEILKKLKQIAWQDGRAPAEMAQRLFEEAVRSRAAARAPARLRPVKVLEPHL